jgi:tight adherence protein C
MMGWVGILLISLSLFYSIRATYCSGQKMLLPGLRASRTVVPAAWKQRYIAWIARQLEHAGHSKAEAEAFISKQARRALMAVALSIVLGFMGVPWMLSALCVPLIHLHSISALHSKIKRRRRDILRTLPYYFDLITLSLEAGLDLIAAIDEVVQGDKPNPLRDELRLTLTAIQMGTVRSVAFHQLAQRTCITPLHSLSSLITQSVELGSSLANLLRLQSETLRREMFLRAEEKAQKAPVKLLLPLVMLIFPVIFILLFAPILMRLTLEQ